MSTCQRMKKGCTFSCKITPPFFKKFISRQDFFVWKNIDWDENIWFLLSNFSTPIQKNHFPNFTPLWNFVSGTMCCGCIMVGYIPTYINTTSIYFHLLLYTKVCCCGWGGRDGELFINLTQFKIIILKGL